MKRSLSLLLVGIVVTLLYDTASAIIARSTGVSYGWFAVGSIALYFIFGFLVANHSGWINGMAAGAFIGLFESTLGWTISWIILDYRARQAVNERKRLDGWSDHRVRHYLSGFSRVAWWAAITARETQCII
jgi:hypothetical protein